MFVIRLFGASVLVVCVLACSHSIESMMDARGYRYPLHVDRLPHQARSTANIGGTCGDAPEHLPFLIRAVAGIVDADAEVIRQEHCPNSEAVALTDPFVVMPPEANRAAGVTNEEGVKLAMILRCYGRGDPARGVSVREASPEIRSNAVERALDGWLVDATENGWVKWNAAVFAVRNGRTIFERMALRFDEQAQASWLVPGYRAPATALRSCMTTADVSPGQ